MMLAVYAVNAKSKHIGPVFCLTSLLQRSSIFGSFIDQLRPVLHDLLDGDFSEPTADEAAYMAAVVDLVRFERNVRTTDDAEPVTEKVRESFEDACATLQLFYVRNGRLRHACRLLCCPGGKADAVEKIARALEVLVYDRKPDLPALNKWLKQFHPNVYHLVGFIFGTSPEMFLRSQGRKGDTNHFEFAEEHLIGPAEDSVVKAINASRNRKSNKYLQNQPESWDNLCIATLLYRLVMECLYTVFNLASSYKQPDFAAFVHPETGAPTRLVMKIFDLLVNLDDPYWVLLRGASCGDWTVAKVEKLFDFATTLIGHIILRMIEPFELWPWPLRFLGDGTISDAVQRGVLQALAETCTFCRDELLSDPFFIANGGKPGVLALTNTSDDVVRVRHMFKRARPSNQGSEWRFARLANAVSYRAGGFLRQRQLSARHTVADHAARWGDIARKAIDAARGEEIEVESNCTSPWTMYCGRMKRCYKIPMPEAAKMRGRLSDAEKEEEKKKKKNMELKADDERIHSSASRQLMPHETPHCLGDHEWPVSPANCHHLCYGDTLAQVANQWHASFGHRIEADPATLTVDASTGPQRQTCGETFGAFNCVKNFEADELERHADIKDSISMLQRYHKTSPRKLCICIEHSLDVPNDDDYYPRIFLLSLCGLYNTPQKQIFNFCRCIGPPVVGSALELQRMSYTNNAPTTLLI